MPGYWKFSSLLLQRHCRVIVESAFGSWRDRGSAIMDVGAAEAANAISCRMFGSLVTLEALLMLNCSTPILLLLTAKRRLP